MCEQEQLIAHVGAVGKEYILDEADVRVLKNTSSADWKTVSQVSERCGVGPRDIELLVEFGFLLSDDDRVCVNAESLAQSLWNEDALYYHQRCKWEGQDAHLPSSADGSEENRHASETFFARRTAQLGEIPGHFHGRVEPKRRIQLATSKYLSPLIEVLQDRRTTRLFNTEEPLELDALSVVLRYSFGCHGIAHLAKDVIALKKTSPSGGAMHPVEVYPLVVKVQGLEPGIYHYHVGEHALEPMQPCSEAEARAWAGVFTAGQGYYTTANVLFLYSARFERSYWKYRRNPRAYKVSLIDLGHLSQTLYLMCAELGLGAFFTAACNEVDIEKALGIDGIREGVLAVGGMGVPAEDADAMGLKVTPYVPRHDPS